MGGAFLEKVAKEDLSENVTLEQKPMGNEYLEGKLRGKSQCRSAKVELQLACVRNGEEVSVADSI